MGRSLIVEHVWREQDVGEQIVVEEKSYRLSRAGRRMAYLLLAGAALIWLFALWTLKNTLQIAAYPPQEFLDSVRNLFNRLGGVAGAPLQAEEAIPAVIMLVLVLVVPLLIWNLIEELRASYTVGPAGVTFRSGSIVLSYPWSEIVALRPVDEEEEEPLDELVVRTSRLGSIRNPLLRFLHWQAYGRRKLPLYSGLEEREELIARLRAFMVGDLAAVAGETAIESPAAAGPVEAACSVGDEESPVSSEQAGPAERPTEGAVDLPWATARPLNDLAPDEGEEGAPTG